MIRRFEKDGVVHAVAIGASLAPEGGHRISHAASPGNTLIKDAI